MLLLRRPRHSSNFERRMDRVVARVQHEECPRPESNQRTRFRKRRASLRKLLQAPDF
jgi:hypothetical protein